MKHRIGLFFLSLTLLLLLHSCEKEEGLGVAFIFLEVDKNFALVEGDQIVMSTTVNDADFNQLQGISLEYLVDGIPLPDSIFRPTGRGTFELSARYKDIESKAEVVEVVDPALDLEELLLAYDGYTYLTTNDWSVTGNFSYAARIGENTFPINPPNLNLLLNGEEVAKDENFHFTEAGTQTFQARLDNFSSNTISVAVREEQVYEEIVIPVVFHTYDVDFTDQNKKDMIDTLNKSFNRSNFSKERVLAGLSNPNTVNCYIRFELATSPPPGKTLTALGHNKIQTANGEYPVLTLDRFRELEAEEVWPYEEYLNFWFAEEYDFEFAPINISDQGSGNARGLTYSPYTDSLAIPGLAVRGTNPRNPDPETLSHSILLRFTSVVDFHQDFIVNRVAYFFGLFDTLAFGCEADGDFCKDTFTPDFGAPFGPANEYSACEGPFFFPSNHMGLGRNKDNFTYDQRARMRLVLEHALFRPGN